MNIKTQKVKLYRHDLKFMNTNCEIDLFSSFPIDIVSEEPECRNSRLHSHSLSSSTDIVSLLMGPPAGLRGVPSGQCQRGMQTEQAVSWVGGGAGHL